METWKYIFSKINEVKTRDNPVNDIYKTLISKVDLAL